MTRNENPFSGPGHRNEQQNTTGDRFSHVRAEINELVDGFDLRQVVRGIEEAGKASPATLAAGAFVFGLAAGIFLRRKIPS